MGHRAVVVATSAMARLYIADLVAELSRRAHEVRVLSYFPGGLFDSAAVVAMTERGAEVRQYDPATNLERLRDRRAAHHLLRKWLQAGPTDLFHVHPNQFLTNWISFDRKRRAALGVRLNLMPDGLANYYVAKMNSYDRPTTNARLSNAMLGIPYHPNTGTVLGLESLDYRSYWYVGSPGVMGDFMPTHAFDVAKPPLAEPLRPDTWLFLGQPSAGEQFDHVYRRLLAAVVDKSNGKVHYKPHPFEKLTDDVVTTLEQMGFVLVHSDLPAEQLGLSYGFVSGVLSSALVNLRVLGWHDAVYGVLDADVLAELSARTLEEAMQISSAAARLGIHPIPLQSLSAPLSN